MKRISIVMPVKNAMPYLEECMASIVGQTYKNWELIAVDDHSTDESLQVLRKWTQSDQRVILLKNEGQGIIPALQCAVNRAQGDFITRMDADDIMASHKLSSMYNSLKGSGKGYVAVGLVRYISDNGVGEGYRKYEKWLNNLTQGGTNFNEVYKECVIPSPCWMLHYDDFESCGGFHSVEYPEDYDLCFRMKSTNLKISPTNEIIHFWRDHPTRTSRNSEDYADNRFLALKCKWFLSDDYVPDESLYIWGAGKKGKEIAKFLKSKNISFSWITENEKKKGVDIYGITLIHPPQYFSQTSKIIIAVANSLEQRSIITYLENAGLTKGKNILLFC